MDTTKSKFLHHSVHCGLRKFSMLDDGTQHPYAAEGKLQKSVITKISGNIYLDDCKFFSYCEQHYVTAPQTSENSRTRCRKLFFIIAHCICVILMEYLHIHSFVLKSEKKRFWGNVQQSLQQWFPNVVL